MRRFLVMGAGKMGIVLAKDLIESDNRNKVTLVDISSKRLQKAKKFIKSERLILLKKDVEKEKQRQDIFEGQDVALAALLHKHSLLALETAILKGVHFADLVGEKPLDRLKYDSEAKKKKVTIISGLGVSPGITNICVGRAVHLLDEVEKAMIYVGGNPVYPKPPLNYRIVYAVESVLDFYERKALILKKGKIKEVPPLSGIESIQFHHPFSEMECFYTDGLSSLAHTMQGKIKGELAEKTIRHKGHAQGIKILKECGFFSRQPIKLHNTKIIPRELLEVLLDSKMKLGKERDATLLRIVVEGKKSSKPTTHIFEMIDLYDSEKDYTSMGKTTSFPASIAAQMIASGKIAQRGSLFPEEIFQSELYQPLMDALKERGVVVTHKVISGGDFY
ncbi:MAG: saccharopine dehydrogenase NADP-binding domain-containing protein [Candidatus Aminicenantes bacterium]|nr:saccharopine dehydrogenase NADP-binding domain-containing protein [Candidatus Aminicenantes bacterium]